MLSPVRTQPSPPFHEQSAALNMDHKYLTFAATVAVSFWKQEHFYWDEYASFQLHLAETKGTSPLIWTVSYECTQREGQ